MWKNILELAMQQMTKWRMHIACWMTKATERHLEYVIFIAFPLQQWFHCYVYMYIACLVFLDTEFKQQIVPFPITVSLLQDMRLS